MAQRMSFSLACLAQACGFSEQPKGRKARPAAENDDVRVPFQVLLVPGFSPAPAQLPALLHGALHAGSHALARKN